METANEITVIGRVGATDAVDKFKDEAGVALQNLWNGDTIRIGSVKEMVTRVMTKANGEKIGRLSIHDHGLEDGGCWIGADYITADNFEKHAPYLAKLFPYFTASAIVHLGHCWLGKNEALLQMFAATFGVAVVAGTGMEAGAPYNFNFGSYTRCSRSGTIYHNVPRP